MEKQEDNYQKLLQVIGAVAKFPIIKVNREEFLRKQFKDSAYLNEILSQGPQAVYTTDSLLKKSQNIIKASTRETAITSFVAGLPSNPAVMVAAGSADVVQYFAFAINMAQKIAYLFGEDQLFDDNGENLPEEAQVRIVAYLGAMFGVSGAGTLIAKVSKTVGENVGKKVAKQALTKTTWYPLVKRIGTILGTKITKKTVEKVITKAVPVIGGVISGGLTYATFKPLGRRLATTLARNLNGEFMEDLELRPEFAEKIITDVEFEEI